jgi:sugar/nucleoside kinase (ribokinase family)
VSSYYFDCTVVGGVYIDATFLVESLDSPLAYRGTTYSSFATLSAGGSGANLAAAISVLKGRSAFIGNSGNDALSELFIRNMSSYDCYLRITQEKKRRTGLIAVFVDPSGERSFLCYRGANDDLSPNDVENSKDVIENSKFLVISGVDLANSPQREALYRAAELATRSGVEVVFDAGSYDIVKKQRESFEKILSISSIFSPNLDEAKALTGEDNLHMIVKSIRKLAPLIVLKMGRKGCLIINEKDIIRCLGFEVKTVDTTGAGDAFLAAFIYAIARNFSLENAGVLSNWFASKVIRNVGARTFPTQQEIKSFRPELEIITKKKTTSNWKKD